MRQPGFIKVDVFHIAVKHAFDGFGVVQHAVIGGLGECQHPGLDGGCVEPRQVLAHQRVGLYFGLDGGRLEFTLRNRPDDAEVVARRLEEHRDRPRHDDGMQDGLVAIAVYHHHIIGRYRVMPDHLVAGAGAIGDKKAVVGIENSGRITLRGCHRSGVV